MAIYPYRFVSDMTLIPKTKEKTKRSVNNMACKTNSCKTTKKKATKKSSSKSSCKKKPC